MKKIENELIGNGGSGGGGTGGGGRGGRAGSAPRRGSFARGAAGNAAFQRAQRNFNRRQGARGGR